MKKYVIKLEEFMRNGSIQTVCENGKCVYYGKPEKWYLENGYQLYTEAGLDILFEERRKEMSKDWVEVSEEDYYDALEVLPPLKWYDGGFYISEATWADMHAFYIKYNGKYYSSCQSVFDKREDIVNKLKEYIGA